MWTLIFRIAILISGVVDEWPHLMTSRINELSKKLIRILIATISIQESWWFMGSPIEMIITTLFQDDDITQAKLLQNFIVIISIERLIMNILLSIKTLYWTSEFRSYKNAFRIIFQRIWVTASNTCQRRIKTNIYLTATRYCHYSD